jgi:hypothetical protein
MDHRSIGEVCEECQDPLCAGGAYADVDRDEPDDEEAED